MKRDKKSLRCSQTNCIVVQLEQLPSKKNMTGRGSGVERSANVQTTIDQVRSIGMQTRVYDNRRGR